MQELSKIGFGCYRVSNRSQEHKEALTQALALGCNLIDTSANYSDGESEILVGEVAEGKAHIVTKGGYIQGQNLKVLEELHQANLAQTDLVDLSPSLKHSIHPDFLANQIELSLQRLKGEKIDTFLLHNPEYFFKQSEGNTSREEYYRRIAQALFFLEEQVAEGRIGSYGISSNTFPALPDQADATDLRTILEITTKIKAKYDACHFDTIQFPFNYIEDQARRKIYGEQSLLSLAKENQIRTMANRPLNAFEQGGLLRLAEFRDFHFLEKKSAEIYFQEAIEALEGKWKSLGEDLKDLHGIPLFSQFKQVWNNLPSPDAVDQVFMGHFFPFLANIWGEAGVPPQEAQVFYDLYEVATELSRKEMNQKANGFRSELEDNGVISPQDQRPLSLILCQLYLEAGVDHILVGMRNKTYVEDLSPLLK